MLLQSLQLLPPRAGSSSIPYLDVEIPVSPEAAFCQTTATVLPSDLTKNMQCAPGYSEADVALPLQANFVTPRTSCCALTIAG